MNVVLWSLLLISESTRQAALANIMFLLKIFQKPQFENVERETS